MSQRGPGSGNVLEFHTKYWFARERAAKRILELEAEMRRIEAWLKPPEVRKKAPEPTLSLVSTQGSGRPI